MTEKWSLSAPVALFAFNRPDTTARVFERIRAAEPPELCLVADDDRADYHADLFDSLYEGRVTGWSRAWRFAMFRNGALSVVPARNLVTNVGFDERGHYATDPDSPLAGLPGRDLEGPYEERATVIPDREYERECFDRFRRTHPALRALSLVPNPAFALVPNSLKRTVADRIT